MIRSATRVVSKLSKRARATQQHGIFSSVSTPIDIKDTLGPSSLSTSGSWNGKNKNDLSKRTYTSTTPSSKTVSITYVEADGTSKTVDAEVGADLMSVAHDNDIELEGACGGELACSTCHLIFDADVYETLPEKEDEE